MPKLTTAQMKKAVEEFKKQFTGGFYHGSGSNKIKAFDPLKNTDPTKLETPGVTFVTRDPDFAESFLPGSERGGYKAGATMYPVKVKLGKHWNPEQEESQQVLKAYLEKMYPHEANPQDLVDIQKDMSRAEWTDIENPNFLQHLRDTGHDTFHVMEGGVPNVGIFEPKNIRGKFAKFNPEDAESADFMKAEGGSVEGYAGGGLALKLAKQIAPKFNLETIRNMPVGSAKKQTPVARAFEMLSSENVDPKIKDEIFKQYLKMHPELVKKSGATNYDELTQAAYQKMAKETSDQFQAMEGAGIKLAWDPTGEQGYNNSSEMLEDALKNKQLTVFQGGELHPLLSGIDPSSGRTANEQFRAAHDYFGHGTTGASFGPKGEELAYGAHSQMYSPLARLAAAAETRGQNSFVNYSGINEDLIKKMNAARAEGASPEELRLLGQQWQYAPQKALILPPEQVDIQYPGYAGGGKVAKKALEFAKSVPFVHYSKAPNISELDPNRYGTGIKGAEAGRLKNEPDIRPRSYIYTKAGGRQPEQGLGPYKYEGVAEDIYPLHDDPAGYSAIAKQKAIDPYMMQFGREMVDEKTHLNELERLIKGAGYRGYANDDVGLLFHPTPVIKAE